MPESGYLIQLRNIFLIELTRGLFERESHKVIHRELSFNRKSKAFDEVELDETSLYHLLNMTPLTWNVDKEKMQKVNNMRISRIIADFRILCGNKF